MLSCGDFDFSPAWGSRNFDLKLILDDAVNKGLVDPGHVVGGVELISEIFGGSGELWLERFQAAPNGKTVRETASSARLPASR